MKTLRFASMLLITVMLAFGMSGCSSDDDEEEPLPDDGWGQVDDEEDDGQGGGGEQASIVGYWNISSEERDSTARIGLRLTTDGKATYEHFVDGSYGDVMIVAQGDYTVVGDRLILDYTDVTVRSEQSDNYYWGYEDSHNKVVVYDILAMPTTIDQRLVLATFDNSVMTFSKLADVNSLLDKLQGHWNVSNAGYAFTQDFTFTQDGEIEFRLSGRSGYSNAEVTAKGSYTLTEGLTLIAEYYDVSVSNDNGGGTFNEFTDGERVTVTYDLIPMLSLDLDNSFILRQDYTLLELVRQDESDEPSVGNSSLVGTWSLGQVTVNGKSGIIQIVFAADGTGRVEAWYDEGGFDVYPFEYSYFYDSGDNSWFVEFIWTGMYGLMFEDGIDYEVTVTKSRLMIGEYLFARQ